MSTHATLQRDEYETWMAPPPEPVRLRWLELLQRLRVGWRTKVDLPDGEAAIRRNIIRWVMSERGARRSLPLGIFIQAWCDLKNEARIVVIRTR